MKNPVYTTPLLTHCFLPCSTPLRRRSHLKTINTSHYCIGPLPQRLHSIFFFCTTSVHNSISKYDVFNRDAVGNCNFLSRYAHCQCIFFFLIRCSGGNAEIFGGIRYLKKKLTSLQGNILIKHISLCGSCSGGGVYIFRNNYTLPDTNFTVKPGFTEKEAVPKSSKKVQS